MKIQSWMPPLKNYFELIKAQASQVYRFRNFRKWSIAAGLAGVMAGLGAILFNFTLQTSINLFEYLVAILPNPWLIALIPAFGGLLSGAFKYASAKETFESPCATDAMIDAIHTDRGRVKTRTPFVTIIAASLTIGSGGSCGRECPTAYIGTGFGSITWDLIKRLKLERRFGFKLDNRDRRIIGICGAAAGLGAIFQAPLGSALFSTEVLYIYGMELEAIFPAFISSIASYLLFSLTCGYKPLFKVTTSWVFNFPDLAFCIIAGFIASLVGLVYIKLFYTTFHFFRRVKAPDYVKPAIGGLLMGLIVPVFPQVWGMGYEVIQDLIDYKLVFWLVAVLILAKILATSLSIGSGGAGGVIAPSIFIGALVGCFLGKIFMTSFPSVATHPSLYVVIGMGALYVAVGKVPLAFTIMLCEAVRNFSFIVPLAAAATASYLVSGYFTIYESQHADSAKEIQDVLKKIYVYQVMNKEVVTISPEVSVMDALRQFGDSTHHAFPVVDNEELQGILTFDDARCIPYKKRNEAKVRDVMAKDLFCVFPFDTARKAMDIMHRKNIGRVLVVDPRVPDKMLGIVTRTDIIDAYERLLEE